MQPIIYANALTVIILWFISLSIPSCAINDCTRAYMFKIDLKRHQRSVHGIIEKTFVCQICSKVFYENKYLTKHLATAHP